LAAARAVAEQQAEGRWYDPFAAGCAGNRVATTAIAADVYGVGVFVFTAVGGGVGVYPAESASPQQDNTTRLTVSPAEVRRFVGAVAAV